MKSTRRFLISAGIVALVGAMGVAAAAADGASVSIGSGSFIPNPAFVTGTAVGPNGTTVVDATNPADGATGRVHVTVGIASGASTVATLHVDGLPANRTFGAHLHRDPCAAAGPGGPHYQHPGGTPSSTATPENELWLDFTTNAAGQGRATTAVPFAEIVGARSIVVHQFPSNAVGVAGQRMGCLPLTLD